VRDFLGSLRNAERLLRNIRVGPKALASVVPLLHASCGPLRAAWQEAGELLGKEFPACTRALSEFVLPRISELEQGLGEALVGPLNAKQRLALERVVIRAAADLDAARALMDLLGDALGGSPALVDLWELTRETFQASEGPPDSTEETLGATLERGDSVELAVNPRVAMGLIALSVKIVALDHPGVPHVAIHRISRSECGVVISRGPGQGEALLLHPPRVIPPTLDCARAAVRATRGRMDVADDLSRVSLIWPTIEE
jgi:hypothetical protein